MKPLARLFTLTALGLCSQTLPAAPLVSLGNGVDLFFTGTAGLSYVDNLFYLDKSAGNTESDWILNLRPGLELRGGRPGTPVQFTLWVENEFKAYLDRSDLDRDNLSVRGNLSYDTDRTKFSAQASWLETDQSTFDIRLPGQLVVREISEVSAKVEHRLSGKTSAALGFGYYEQDFISPLFVDHDHFSIPVDFYYSYSPKLDLSVGYRWRETDVAGGIDSRDQFFNVGARGELLPKVTGSVRVGTHRRNPDVGANSSTLGVNTDLAWAATAKTTVNLGVDRDFGTSGGGTSTRSMRTTIAASHQFSSFLSGNAFVNLTNTDYANNRSDDTLATGFGMTYAPSNTLRFAAGYTFQNNDSTAPDLNYENHILNFSASLRF